MIDLTPDLAGGFLTPAQRKSPSTAPVPDSGIRRTEEEDILDAINEVAAEEDDFSSGSDEDAYRERSWGQVVTRRPHHLKPITVQLPASTLVHPRSVGANFVPPLSPLKEKQAVQILLNAEPSQKDEDFIEFQLDQFCCYVDTAQYDSEMRALHSHATSSGKETYFFDGILRVGTVQCYVQRVAFEEIPLGNYGKEEPSVGDQIWIRSLHNRRKEIYYKLQTPAFEYTRYHNKFVWVADLAKHVVDFCTHVLDQGHKVSIHLFREDFSTWLKHTHQNNTSFQKWYAQRGSDDFRQSIVVNNPFIRKEVWSMIPQKKQRHISIFSEISSPFNAIPVQGVLPAKDEYPPTIVTPYIYDCFSHLELGNILQPVRPSFGQDKAISGPWPPNTLKEPVVVQEGIYGAVEGIISRIQPGHLISTPPDEEESGTKWKTHRTDKKWYGLVKKVRISKRDRRRFDVTWLYQPEDTPCCSMKYPWDNELFLSNHCTCEQSEKVREDQVLGVHSVAWHGNPDSQADFFVRQTYLSEEGRFVTLQAAHRRCDHEHTASPSYSIRDTVLVKLPRYDYLEPCELLEYLETGTQVRLRRLARRSEFSSGCPPNELVYTEQEICCRVSAIATRCIIRCYTPEEKVPVPYNQRGVGNAFFVTHRLLQDGRLQPWTNADEPSFRQGFDPHQNVKKLRALDLFSGIGNLGRGFEDGGAVEAKWVNDIWDVAAHTYMVNSKNPISIAPFLGSIDELLRLGLARKFSKSVPKPSEVDVILGGSPCQGFSLITQNKGSRRQIKNRSMVASFASAVDLWRPKWGILENVRTIVQSSKDNKENCFSQLICALVGMGYQMQIILGDAWSYGAPQGRVRVFLCFAAPGLQLPHPPYPSHSNPKGKSSGKLGNMTNGEPYVSREDRPTAFKYVTVLEATADLPDIYDSNPDTCIAFPDHRLSVGITTGRGHYGRRKQIRSIPISPYGVNFVKAYYGRNNTTPDMFSHEARHFPLGAMRTKPVSKAWGRQHPHQLFGTITTSCNFSDARLGGSLMHWNQPRPLTVMEARRAQGVPDDEVLCGAPRDQWKLVGNAVARQVSIALGLMLRQAWAGTLYEGAFPDVPTVSSVPTPAVSVIQEPETQNKEEQDVCPVIVYDDDDESDDDYVDDPNGMDDADDADDADDVMSLGELTSQAEAGPFSSTRATSLIEILEVSGRDTSASTGRSAANEKKRQLSETNFAPGRWPPSPVKKQRVEIVISDDEDDDLEYAGAADPTAVHIQHPNDPTMVTISIKNNNEEEDGLEEVEATNSAVAPARTMITPAAVQLSIEGDEELQDAGSFNRETIRSQTMDGPVIVGISDDEEDGMEGAGENAQRQTVIYPTVVRISSEESF